MSGEWLLYKVGVLCLIAFIGSHTRVIKEEYHTDNAAVLFTYALLIGSVLAFFFAVAL